MKKTYIALAIGAALVLAGCSGPGSGASSSPSVTPEPSHTQSAAQTPSAQALTGDMNVMAAASLTNVFTEIGEAFEDANPGVAVTFQFDGSSALATQIIEGASVDVFASADQNNMDKVTTAGEATSPEIFALNNLVLAVPAANPASIAAVKDLERAEVTTVVCAPEVPCGTIAANVLAAAEVTITPASEEASVSAVATKLSAGEADAGFVYSTDVAASAGKLVAISLPNEDDVEAAAKTEYPITALKASANAELAQAFIDFVMSAEGQALLAEAGFGSPE